MPEDLLLYAQFICLIGKAYILLVVKQIFSSTKPGLLFLWSIALWDSVIVGSLHVQPLCKLL